MAKRGLRARLGTLPFVDYQYTPMPFNEMLRTGLFAQNRKERAEDTLFEINKLYASPILPQNKEQFNLKKEAFESELAERLSDANGNIISLGSFLRDSLRNIATDPEDVQALSNVKRKTDYVKSLSDLSPHLQTYYINKADAEYEKNEGKGLYPIFPVTNLKETEFNKILDDAAKNTPLEKSSIINITGGQQQDIDIEQKPYNKVYNNVANALLNNTDAIEFARVNAEALGIDFDTYLNNRVRAAAEQRSFRNEMPGKFTPFTGGSENFLINMPPSTLDPEGQKRFSFRQGFASIFGGGKNFIDVERKIIDDMSKRKEEGILNDNQYAMEQSMYNAILRESGIKPEQYDILKKGKENFINKIFSANTKDRGFKWKVFQNGLNKKFNDAAERLFGAISNPQAILIIDNKKEKAALEEELFQNPEKITIDDGKNAESITGTDKFEITTISNRMYTNIGENTPYFLVSGKYGKTGDEKPFTGRIPADIAERYINDIQPGVQTGPIAKDLSSLRFEGQMAITPYFEILNKQFSSSLDGNKIAAMKTKDGYALVIVNDQFVRQTDEPIPNTSSANMNEFVNKITQYINKSIKP